MSASFSSLSAASRSVVLAMMSCALRGLVSFRRGAPVDCSHKGYQCGLTSRKSGAESTRGHVDLDALTPQKDHGPWREGKLARGRGAAGKQGET